MSSIQTRHENRTELRLDYKDLVAGRLVIVIDGLPSTGDVQPGTEGRHPTAPSLSEVGRGHAVPPAPLVDEMEAISESIGYRPALFPRLLLAAWKGREALALELVAAMVDEATAADEARVTALAEYAKAVLYNGLGRYEDAVAAAHSVCADDPRGLYSWAHLELVEAATRTNARAIASEALRELDDRTPVNRTDWGLGVRARSAALLSEGARAEGLYHDAIELLGRSGTEVHHARAQLVYGEWLRRENRRVDARVHLRAAHETFSRVAAEAFAARALSELLATGETARKRTDETRGVLTPQEAQIARLACDGLSNPEIGAQLYISPRTVQYHLRKVFRKLEITSRNQLARLPAWRLGSALPTAVPIGENA